METALRKIDNGAGGSPATSTGKPDRVGELRGERINQLADVPADDLKSRLVDFAHVIGFDSCRIAACNAPLNTEEFRDWLNKGAAGEMSYMERGAEKRGDPQKVLPAARSIIVLA